MKRLLLFDVDGTLVDTGGAGRAAIRAGLEAVFGEAGPVETFQFHGRTDPGIVRGLLRAAGWEDPAIDGRLERLWPVYLRELERELAARDGDVRPCPGVPELLERLRDDPRFEVALVTGNVAAGAWRKLGAAGLAGHFEYGAFGSDSEHREDLPPVALERASRRLGRVVSPGDAWIVGDTPEDIRCARSSGVRVLAVATGRPGADELRGHDPDHLFADLRATEAVVEALAR